MDYSLSVVVCSYNRYKLLRKCIAHLIKIKKEVIPIEIVVIDDGSKNLVDIEFQNYLFLNKIIYKRNEQNRGLAFSRNIGIKESSSKYILICDDDDMYIKPENIKKIYLEMIQNNTDIGIGMPTSHSSFKNDKYNNLQEIFSAGITPPVSYQIYKKALIEKDAYNDCIKAGIDIDLWINLLKKNPKVSLIKNCDIKSFKHKPNSSLTTNYEKRKNNLISSRKIWEKKITEIYGDEFFLKFKKASLDYELWFVFLDNLSRNKFMTSLIILAKNFNYIFLFRLYRYFIWKFLNIKMPVNSHLINLI